WATISLLSNMSSLPSSTIPPQITAVSQQQQSQLIPIARVNSTTASNSTAGQNYTFAATSPVPSTSAQLIYLGYHGDTKSSHGNDGSKHDDSSHSKRSSTRSTSDSSSKEKDPKPFTPPPIKIDSIKPPKIHNTKTTSDDSSTSKKKTTSSTKLIKSDNSDSKDNSKSNTKLPHIKKIISIDSGSNLNKKTKHSDHSTDTTTPSPHKITRSNYDNTPKQKTKSDPNDDSSDTKSSSHNSKSSSIIENDIPSVIMKSFNPKHSTDSDSSDEGVDSFFGGDKFFSDEGDDGF
ncbi:MAG TPA: hypothetical protein VE593_04705, partial [Nitrososphaeraceae archaeon]|nr:hypothetical protein [Nitrososphaeraceae archaeon]